MQDERWLKIDTPVDGNAPVTLPHGRFDPVADLRSFGVDEHAIGLAYSKGLLLTSKAAGFEDFVFNDLHASACLTDLAASYTTTAPDMNSCVPQEVTEGDSVGLDAAKRFGRSDNLVGPLCHLQCSPGKSSVGQTRHRIQGMRWNLGTLLDRCASLHPHCDSESGLKHSPLTRLDFLAGTSMLSGPDGRK
jgi:hypothetical protein